MKVIGISAYVEQARWGVWDQRAVLVPESYVAMIRAAGARAVLLPPDEAGAPDLVRRLDGLVLAGGADIEPARYGAADRHELTVTRPDRDAGEVAVLEAALEADLPVLGVCRGMELLAVAYGGALHQHLPDVLAGDPGHQPSPGVYGSHPARFIPGSRAAAIFGERTEVNSYHHQAVADPGKLTVTGWADDVVEAVEDPSRRFVFGVQWHPEAMADVRPFAALVAAAR
jgi:putative glutamine amidotransferase